MESIGRKVCTTLPCVLHVLGAHARAPPSHSTVWLQCVLQPLWPYFTAGACPAAQALQARQRAQRTSILHSSCRMVFTMRSGLSSEEERLRISSTPRYRKKSWMLNSSSDRSTPCTGQPAG